MKRLVPPEVFEYWATCFQEGKLSDEYADELAQVLFLLANNARFEIEYEQRYHGYPYDNTIH